jgi:uncharacterized protein
VIVADTGALVALVDRDDALHATVRRLFRETGGRWVLPWAILPEIDYLLAAHVGRRAEEAFLEDIAAGAFSVEWHERGDLVRAEELCRTYRALELGLVDGVVMATAERIGAEAIVTTDARHFGAVELAGKPQLWPRDLGANPAHPDRPRAPRRAPRPRR